MMIILQKCTSCFAFLLINKVWYYNFFPLFKTCFYHHNQIKNGRKEFKIKTSLPSNTLSESENKSWSRVGIYSPRLHERIYRSNYVPAGLSSLYSLYWTPKSHYNFERVVILIMMTNFL